MTSDFDDHLRALFADAHRPLPPADFTAAVSARLRAQRQRVRRLQIATVLIAILSAWAVAPDLINGAAAFNRLPDMAGRFAERSGRAILDSPVLPLLYVYGGTLAVTLLLRLLYRYRIRFV